MIDSGSISVPIALLGRALALSVPVLVSMTVGAGLIQLLREALREHRRSVPRLGQRVSRSTRMVTREA